MSVSPSKINLRLPRSSAFTLIELLVTIAIIAILVALVVPVTQKVIARSVAAQCIGKIRSVGLGVMTYAQENGTTPIFDIYGWQGRGLPTDEDSGSNWRTKIINPGYADRAAFFCAAATRNAPEMTNPSNPSISAYALQLNGVSNLKLNSISPDDSFDWDGSNNRDYFKSKNIPLVMEYMAVHPKGTVNAFFCDGSVRAVDSSQKVYGLVQFEPNPDDHYITFIREPL